METIHVVTACSDSYAKHLAVMLNSLLENQNSNREIVIYIIESGISDLNKARIRKSLQRFNKTAQFITIDSSIFTGYKVTMHFSQENFYRVLIPNLLNKNVEKALYLDCDIIVKEDLLELWNTNIDEYFLAGVQDGWGVARCGILSIPSVFGYFNSGVLLINLKKWRENDISQQVLEFIKMNPEKAILLEQDGLNRILYDKWLRLDAKWNYQTDFLKIPHLHHIKPGIIHFTNRSKPWYFGHPLQDEYFQYLQKTQWD